MQSETSYALPGSKCNLLVIFVRKKKRAWCDLKDKKSLTSKGSLYLRNMYARKPVLLVMLSLLVLTTFPFFPIVCGLAVK